MTIRMKFDARLCQGYSNCLIEAPEIWDFDEEMDVAVLKNPMIDPGLLERARASVRGCPAHAITLDEDA